LASAIPNEGYNTFDIFLLKYEKAHFARTCIFKTLIEKKGVFPVFIYFSNNYLA